MAGDAEATEAASWQAAREKIDASPHGDCWEDFPASEIENASL